MTTFREFETDKAWNYFRTTGPLAVKNIEHFIDFEYRDGEGKHARYECIVKKGWPSMVRPQPVRLFLSPACSADVALPPPRRP